MNWLRYLLEANLYLGVFYLCYCLFLNWETYYMLNRVYLLFSCVISFIIPIIQLGILKPAEPVIKNTVVIVTGNTHQITNHPVQIANAAVKYFTFQDYILFVYLLGVAVLLLLLVFKLYGLLKLTRAKSIIKDQYKLIYVNGSNTAFSFFNYLFIGTKASGADTIIRHELVHIRQKHSMDIILLEVFKIINWFNPFIYLLQNSLKAVHEFIADENTTVSETDTLTYSTFLLNNAYGVSGSSITHSFFNYNLLKKRIIMLNQKRSGSLARLKYLVALPVCTALLCASTLGFSKTYGWVDIAPAHKLIVETALPVYTKADTLKNKGQFTSKGYKYKETGYLIRNKANFRVIITEKNGEEKEYFRNSATSAQINLLKEKYGYTFPSMDIFPKLPPPPPAPGLQTPVPPVKPHGPLGIKRYPPPVVIPVDTAGPGNISKPAPLVPLDKIAGPESPGDAQVVTPMEPYMPLTNAFAALGKYIARYTRFPVVALKNKVTGSVIIKFDLNAGHKLTNVTLIGGIGNRYDEEVIRVLNAFNDPINAKPGTYKLAVTFTMDGLKPPKPASEALGNDPLFIGEVVMTAFYK